MDEQRTTDPNTGLDKFFAALRGIGVRRRTDDKWVAGVCSGLADRLGVDPVIVRAAMVLLILLGGIGVTVYLVAWALLPNDRDELAAERALRDGDGGSIVLIVVAAFALFGGSWWGTDSGWGFPWGLAITSLLVWWLVRRLHNHPDDGQGVSTQQSGTPYSAGPWPATSGPSPTTTSAPLSTTFGPSPAPTFGPSPATFGPSPTAFGPSPTTSAPWQTAPRPMALRRPRRRSGGPLMALLAIGLALVSYGSLSWLGERYGWAGDHTVIAMAGSLAAIGLLLVVIGLAGWRAGFVGFLAIVLAITTFSSSVVPAGIHLGGQIGDATWTPTPVDQAANYHLGIGDGVLNLRELPRQGLKDVRLPAYVGIGELTVVVPEGLTVQVVGHVGAGEILAPGDAGGDGQGGTDVNRLVVVGDGPPEVVVDAGVGIGQLNVVKE